ncbi:SDR family NAD(P)-dependent oxidoreductase [Dactylosporangium siamense]|uniref:Short-chain dehydrogenase n=1 Tax=Dactylosporangium siamense TaxID=685454 RepID=A0A919PYP4_9ACTN|nr:SDR family oxidoreductase [Dactylosporangium siamense]GIG50735.1 short-chain dehydrogenase [Dactylosporangium siamense]
MTVVVVTGGTRGIGHGLVREFLARKCSVVYCGRSLESVAAAFPGSGPELRGVVADVTDRDAVRALWDEAVAAYGPVDIWINNAGVSTARRPLWDLPPAELDEVIDVNLRGVAHASAVVLAAMRAQGHGALWNMEGFGSGNQKAAGLTGYGATKRAVTYLTDALAKELGKDSPVTVAHLSPGMVVTDLLSRDYTPEEFAKAKKIFNILADKVETVTPWLADRVLAGVPNGGRVAWLTTPKAFGRFATAAFRKRDLFA